LKVVLDTHIFLWSISEAHRLSSRVAEVIEDPANELLVSIASMWEIAIKVGIGKFVMPVPLAPYLQRQLVRHGLGVLPIQFSHLARLEQLPHHHRDPFDRLLVAQCIEEDAALITVDSRLQLYPVRIIS
jgi:PIN domain nuclease of toxin-antitoxin system